MSFGLRIFLGCLLLVAAALWVSLRQFRQELVPGMRQSVEEVLVDTANLLATLVHDEVLRGEAGQGRFAAAMREFGQRPLDALIYDTRKTHPSLIVYITDETGRVLYHSRGRDIGEDYSRWNDVFRTLRGEYGARSTRENPDDDRSSVMYVAAPIIDGSNIAGVLTVGKPSVVVMPFVDAARHSLWAKSGVLLALSVGVAALLAYGLTRSIRKLTAYADAVTAERRVPLPRLSERELARLATAMNSMRTQLEGKNYVENYLHALTHELKSPVAAIAASAELLEENVPAEARRKFVANIRTECERVRQVIERLLRLAALEGRSALEEIRECATRSLLREVVAERSGQSSAAGVRVAIDDADETVVDGEPFLLRQAVGNLLDNAIDFSPRGETIELAGTTDGAHWTLEVRDRGPGIPPYAEQRVFERFYSLPRPDGRPKSTGLGLAAVREIAKLHHGSVRLQSREGGGVVAVLILPLHQPSQSRSESSRKTHLRLT